MDQSARGTKAGGYFVWEPPAGDIAILLNLELVDRLRQLIEEAPEHEIGGILLGRCDRLSCAQDRRRIVVDDIEPIGSERHSSPAFILSENDRKALTKSLSGKDRKDGIVPVGFFRSHLRKGFYLDEADFSLFRTNFSDPCSVFLVARPEQGRVPAGGFFYWQGEKIHRQTCYSLFPLDRSELQSGGHLILAVPAAASDRPVAMPTSPAPTTPPRRPGGLYANRRLVNRLTYGTIGAILILAAVLGTMFMRSGGEAEEAMPVALHVETKGDTLRLSWNANSPAVDHANNAALWISDGGKGRRIPLNPEALKSGTFLYTPESRDVSFRMDLEPMPAQGSASVHFVAEREPAKQPAVSQSVAKHNPVSVALQPAPEHHAPEVAKRAPVIIRPRPNPEPTVTITTQVAPPPKYREWVARVPLVRAIQRNRYKAGDAFVAPRPVHEVTPRLPARLARDLPRELTVDFKLSIDRAGSVRAVELRNSGAEGRVTEIAANAMHDWRFEPATLRGKPVSSEILVALHFHNPFSDGDLAKR
jgi:hypothetical protein